MNRPYSKQGKQNVTNQQMKQHEKAIGLDQDEQAMNGLYGMPETELEDNMHKNS